MRTGFRDILEPGSARLLFRYDPARRLIEIQRYGIKIMVDVTEYDDDRMMVNGPECFAGGEHGLSRRTQG